MADVFTVQGPTVLIAANATAPAGVQINGASADIKTNVVRIVNDDANQTVYVGYANTANGAKLNAVIPVAAGNNSIPVLPRTEVILRLNIATPQLFISGQTNQAVSANFFVTPGSAQR